MIWPLKQKIVSEPLDSRGLTDEQAAWIFLGDPSIVNVTAETAMRSTPVRASVKVLAETLGQLPCHLYQRNGDAKSRAPDHPAAKLVNRFSNKWTTAVTMREQAMVDVCLYGNAFVWIGRDGTGKVRELQRLDPRSVTVKRDEATGEPRYSVSTKKGGTRSFGFADIIHISDVSIDGLIGQSPIKAGENAIGLALVLEQHAMKLFENGARPSGVIETKESMGNKGRQRLRDAFANGFAGAMNAGKIPVLDEGMSFKSLALASTDAQFLELRRFAVLEIARIYRMPPHFLAELERTTHANAEQMGAQFLAYTILPWLKAWEAELALKLLTSEEQETYFFEFLVDDLVRADIAARFNAYSQAVTNGILSRNEARAAENRPPYSGGEEFLTPMNMNGGAQNEAA